MKTIYKKNSIKNVYKAFYFFLVCIGGVCMCEQVRAEDALLWQDCVAETMHNNPALFSARQELVQVKADKIIAVSGLLPQVTSRVSTNTSKTGSQKQVDAYAWNITGEQLLFDGFKTPFDIMAASKTLTAQEYTYMVTSSNIRLDLQVAFATLLRAQNLISLTEDIVARRKENLQLVQFRYDAGREHKGAFLTAQADLAQAEFEAAQAIRNLALARQSLCAVLGRKRHDEIVAIGDFDIADKSRAQADIDHIADTTPFLNALIARKESARNNYQSATADVFPKIYLSGSYGKSHSNWPPEEQSWSTGITVSFPLFEGGNNYARISKAKSQFVQAEADEMSGRDEVIVILEESWKEIQDALDTVTVKQKYLVATEERANIANAQYSTGLITFDDWIIIENNLIDTKKAYLNAQADLLIRDAYWTQAQGGGLEYVAQ